MSGDGTKLIVTVGGGDNNVYLYTYNGTTWIANSITPPNNPFSFRFFLVLCLQMVVYFI